MSQMQGARTRVGCVLEFRATNIIPKLDFVPHADSLAFLSPYVYWCLPILLHYHLLVRIHLVVLLNLSTITVHQLIDSER